MTQSLTHNATVGEMSLRAGSGRVNGFNLSLDPSYSIEDPTIELGIVGYTIYVHLRILITC